MTVCIVFLLLRSFCEVVIVGQLDRRPAHLRSILRSRDVTYSVFSILLTVFATLSVPRSKIEDPLMQKDKEVAQDVKRLIEEKLGEMTDQGTKTAPPFPQLLDAVVEILEIPANRAADPQSLEMKLMEIRRLRALYSQCDPVYKWHPSDGQRQNSLFELEEESPKVQKHHDLKTFLIESKDFVKLVIWDTGKFLAPIINSIGSHVGSLAGKLKKKLND